MVTVISIVKSFFIISFSFLLAIILMLIALPSWFEYLRPQMVVLILIYWVLNLPQRVGIVVAWCLGLVLDVLYNVTFGVHALALVLIAYIALVWQVRFNFFIFWQKMALIFVLVLLYFMPQLLIKFIADEHNFNLWLYFVSSLTSALIWPYLTVIFDAVRAKFNLV